MAVITIDRRVAVGWATTIADISAPTTTELAPPGSTRLETLITPDGLSATPTTNGVDVGNLASVLNAQRAGRVSWAIKLTFHRTAVTDDTAWELFPYRTNGFLWVRMGVDVATPIAADDELRVWACETGEPAEVPPAPDGKWDFTSDFFVNEGGYNSRAVVVVGA